MEDSDLRKKVQAYGEWKIELTRTLNHYQEWLVMNDMTTQDIEHKISESVAALDNDRITIAFVAEFSRGKTELINAIFFAKYGRRLLPSSAGRTTMCPTEMFYDKEADKSYVRLLPIESRLQDASLQDLKNEMGQWVHYPLDLGSAEQIEDTLREVVKTRRVSLREAVRLGLYDPELHPHLKNPPAFVEIPRWRHALISFPHPLLLDGLTILDTPGLNALGSEPELTLKMIPASQSILFILAADTGVTRTDLDMWQHHIKGFHNSRKRGLIVVLNKIDTLWDGLSENDQIDRVIGGQCRSTARILGIDQENIFPISAQKGLLAKIRKDDELLSRSNLQQLEDFLSNNILNSRHEIIQETITSDISDMIETSYSMVSSKLTGVTSQLDELRQISGKSQDVINAMMKKTKKEQALYMKNIHSFQASRKVLKEHAMTLRNALDTDKLEKKISKTRHNMSGNWSTLGLRTNMQHLFEDMRLEMQIVAKESEQIRKLIRSIYHRFHQEHSFTAAQPKVFSIVRHQMDLDLLFQEAEIFRNSPVTAMTEKHFVVKRFFIAMVSRARDIFFQARQEVNAWIKICLEPLVYEIHNHHDNIEQHLQDLKKISQSRDTLKARIMELEEQHTAISKDLTSLRNMHNKLTTLQPWSGAERPKPHLVKQSNA
jgi:Dynamin family